MSNFQRRHASPQEFTALVQQYYEQKTAYETVISSYLQNTSDTPGRGNSSGQTSQSTLQTTIMPHHPSEEHAGGNITDQVAKDSKDSTASDHPAHNVDTGTGASNQHGQQKATIADHQANLGPVITDQDIGTPASKDELKARAADLNK